MADQGEGAEPARGGMTALKDRSNAELAVPLIPVGRSKAYRPPAPFIPVDYNQRREWVTLWPWWHPAILPGRILFLGLPAILLVWAAIADVLSVAGASLIYVLYGAWMLARYLRDELNRRLIIRVMRSEEWRQRLAHWIATGG
jgi:hypothetical protein